jgi:hypothetical protein
VQKRLPINECVEGKYLEHLAKCRTEQGVRHGYSDKKLEKLKMPLTQRCNYAGPFGKLIPTRSFAVALVERLRSLGSSLPRLRY